MGINLETGSKVSHNILRKPSVISIQFFKENPEETLLNSLFLLPSILSKIYTTVAYNFW